MPDFYQRRRRLAIAVAVATGFLLAAWLLYGQFPETYSDPLVVAAPDALHVKYRVGRMREEKIVQYLLAVDPQTLAVRSQRQFYDLNTTVWSRGELVGFFGDGYERLKDESRVVHLGQEWPIEAAVRDPATETLWLFGVQDRAVKARTLTDGTADPVQDVAKAEANVEGIQAAFSPEAGVTVVWKEEGRPGLKAARQSGGRFERLSDLPTGDSLNWTALRVGPRLLGIYFDRRDQGWSTLKLRVRCCTECGLPPPAAEWDFRDPFLLLARRVTGVGAAVEGERIRLILTRATALQAASVPLATLTPAAGAALEPIRVEPAWRRYLGLLGPSALILSSVYLVYLGFSLLRLRLLGPRAVAPEGAGAYAQVMQRAVAFVIDLMLIVPVLLVITDALGVTLDTREIDFGDLHTLGAIAAGYLVTLAYFIPQEGWTGQTIGKRLVGIRVVNQGADRLTFGRAVVRNLVRLVDSHDIFMVVGLVCLLFTRRRQRLGDLLAGTVVIQASREEEPPAPAA